MKARMSQKNSVNYKPTKKVVANKRYAIAISLTSFVCFSLVCLLRDVFTEINLNVNFWATEIQTEYFTSVAKIIAHSFDIYILLAVSLLISGVLIYNKSKQQALLLMGTMGLNALLLTLLKTVIYSPRPSNGLMIENGNSFPSGHLTSTLVFLGVLSYLFWQYRNTIYLKIFSIIPLSVVSFIVGLSRIYLNVHWLSDIIAAPFLALFVISISFIVVSYLINWRTLDRLIQ
jgi:undecaprenyl-diphosphatase